MGYEAIPVQSQPEDLFCNRSMVRLSGICLRQIDPLPRPKNNALCGLEIGRHSPQPQSHVERVDAKRGPERKLADLMLFCMAGRAQRNRVAISRLHPNTTIGSCPHMCGLRWRCFSAGNAGKLTNES